MHSHTHAQPRKQPEKCPGVDLVASENVELGKQVVLVSRGVEVTMRVEFIEEGVAEVALNLCNIVFRLGR